MKKISLLAALLVAGVSSAAAQPFNGGYIGATLGFKANSSGAFDTQSMGDVNSKKFHLKKNGLTGGLSLGWGGEVCPNVYLGLQIDFLMGSGSKKVENKIILNPTQDAYLSYHTNHHANANYATGMIRAPIPGAAGAMAGIYCANEYIFGNPIPDVTQTITLKDRFSITPVVQAGYIFKAALGGKDVLGYVEMGPHFAFTKLSVETKLPNIPHMCSLASGDQVALQQGASLKSNKTSIGVGIALGTGVKVAVSDNLVVSLGYRFTKTPGSSAKTTFGGASLKKIKIPSQSHNILVGLAYSF